MYAQLLKLMQNIGHGREPQHGQAKIVQHLLQHRFAALDGTTTAQVVDECIPSSQCQLSPRSKYLLCDLPYQYEDSDASRNRSKCAHMESRKMPVSHPGSDPKSNAELPNETSCDHHSRCQAISIPHYKNSVRSARVFIYGLTLVMFGTTTRRLLRLVS
jgi:hypothetical protein